MIIAVDPDHPLPVYEQVREQVVRMVAAGTLQAGVRLPTIRQLAQDLGLAKGTDREGLRTARKRLRDRDTRS